MATSTGGNLEVGFLRRLLGQPNEIRTAASRPGSVNANAIFGGSEPLEVVGESFYQEALRKIAGPTTEYVRIPVIGTLLPEVDNQYDANATSVWVSGLKVGHLSRDDAALFRKGLLDLQRRVGSAIALPGFIVGGGEGRPSYGVFLNYDPAAFGLEISDPISVQSSGSHIELRTRTGLSNAVLGDADDDDYDLTWQSRVPQDRLKAVTFLRHELVSESAAISRHFMHAQLEQLLYEARDDLASALDEYDAACEAHQAEMPVLLSALIEQFGGVPLIEMYKQAAIRHQKAHDWQAALRWAEAGLQVYGTQALRQEFVDDLERRATDYRKKLEPKPPKQDRKPAKRPTELAVEVLTCSSCGKSFERTRARGRKPERCPDCRAVMPLEASR
jgi:hypothetical protein